MSITNATRLSDFAAGIGTEGAILKIDNANQRVGIGTQLPNQMLTVAGIVSATQYIGDGSQLEGITSAGLGTAIDETEGSAGAVVYYTDDLLTVAETTTINPPASASAAYTQYRDVKLNDSVDLIIETGDDFIPDILGFGTAINDVSAAGNGVFDEVYSSIIKNKDGLGAPAFANGLTSVGVITATGGFSGNVTGNLTGTASNASGATGDFGVGTSSPTARLDVRRGDADGKIAEFHQSAGYGIDIGSSQADAYISSGYLQNFIFKSNPGAGQVERLRINKDGAIGLSGANYGTAGQVLSSQGASAAPQWASVSGAWEKLTSGSATSGATKVITTSHLTSTHYYYKLLFSVSLVSDNQFGINISSNGGTSYTNSSGSWKTSVSGREGSSHWNIGEQCDFGALLAGNNRRYYAGEIKFFNPTNTSKNPSFNFTGELADTLNQTYYGAINSTTNWTTLGSYNAIRFQTNGTISDLKYSLLGTAV